MKKVNKNEACLVKVATFQHSADSFGIRRLGFKCSWWHSIQTNDAIAFEPSILSENHDYKRFFRVAVNTYAPIFRV